MTDRPTLPALTGMRFFLAFLVLLFHQTEADGFLDRSTLNGHPLLAHMLQSGYVSVGFFYLLSGFVLAYGYDLSRVWDAKLKQKFWLARFARIYPVYFLCLLFSLPLFVSLLHRTVPAFHTPTSVIAFITTPVLVQSWFPDSATLWNGPSWSLSDEIFFYLLFPLVGRLLWKIDRLTILLPLAISIWLMGLALTFGVARMKCQVLINMGATGTPAASFWSNLIKYDPLLHLAEFCAGILAAKLHLKLRDKRFRHWWLREGLWLYGPALILEVFVLTHSQWIPYGLLHNGLLVPVHVALLIGLSLGGQGLPRFLGSRPLVFLGQSSYALYLLHVATYSWMHATFKHLSHILMSGLWFLALYSVLCVGLSCIMFAYVEEPARRLILKRFSARLPDAAHLAESPRSP